MARSRLGEDQVIDSDFVSTSEHDNPLQDEVNHYFIYNKDTPSTFSGSAGKVVLVNETEDGLVFSTAVDKLNILFNNSEVESSTTSTEFTIKVEISNIPKGTYIVMWYFEWNSSSVSNYFKNEIVLDTTTVLSDFMQVPVDIASWYGCSGFHRIILDTDSHTVDLNYCSSKSGKVAKIRKARIAIWGCE